MFFLIFQNAGSQIISVVFSLFFVLLLWCFTSTETTRLDRDRFVFFIIVVVVVVVYISAFNHVFMRFQTTAAFRWQCC